MTTSSSTPCRRPTSGFFGFRPTAYHTPDKYIALDKADFVQEVHGWGRSENHGRIANQANLDQRAAIALYTGVPIPATPAQAAGGKADLGGLLPPPIAQRQRWAQCAVLLFIRLQFVVIIRLGELVKLGLEVLSIPQSRSHSTRLGA